jgi:anti-sigma factor RsiW
MSCKQVEPELIAYHFGLVSDDTRREIDSHLVGCGACLRAFLDVKRSIETSEEAPRPSKAARARLRRSVENELHPRPKWSWWERPLAFAAAACAVLTASATTRALTSGPGSPPYATSDHGSEHR